MPLPKMLLKSAELKSNSSEALPTPLLPPEPPVPRPVQTPMLYLPMTVNKSVKSVPLDSKSPSGLLWKRQAEVSNVCLETVQRCTTEKQQCPSPQEITAPKQPKKEVIGPTS